MRNTFRMLHQSHTLERAQESNTGSVAHLIINPPQQEMIYIESNQWNGETATSGGHRSVMQACRNREIRPASYEL